MKVKKTLISYLVSTLVPTFLLLLNGFFVIMNQESCIPCSLNLLIASLLLFGALLVLNSFQFLGLFRLKNELLDRILRVIYAFIPPLFFACFLLSSGFIKTVNSPDFDLANGSMIAIFGTSIYSLYVLMKIRSV